MGVDKRKACLFLSITEIGTKKKPNQPIRNDETLKKLNIINALQDNFQAYQMFVFHCAVDSIEISSASVFVELDFSHIERQFQQLLVFEPLVY